MLRLEFFFNCCINFHLIIQIIKLNLFFSIGTRIIIKYIILLQYYKL